MKNTDPNINATTQWHTAQRVELAKALNVIETWPPYLRGVIGGKILSLSNAVDSISGKPKVGSNHNTVSVAIDALVSDLSVMAVRENA